MFRYDICRATACWEHRAKPFLVFIDLKKSVPREALCVWLKLGVPESMIKLIRSFHCGMQAQIRLNDDKLDNNGLRKAAPWP